MRSREDLFPAEAKIESFLTDLAVHANVAPATQNQAMNALVFLYKRVLNHPLQDSINAVRADKKINVPVVMTREEVAAVISLMDGTAQVVTKLLYGSGLRIMVFLLYVPLDPTLQAGIAGYSPVKYLFGTSRDRP